MLRLMRIRNLALIREVEIEFGRGLNLLTGETGSGKSILVDALGLLLGARSSQEMIRFDCETAVLEGIFEIGACQSILRLLAESGFESEDDTLLIRREIATSGRSRVFINNHLATLSLLKTIGERLADIHGQQEQRSLLDLSTHLEWLDYFGGNAELLKEVREHFKRLRNTAKQLELMETNEQERLRRIDVLQFQIGEIRRVDPHPDEKEELEKEQIILSNREKILALATETYAQLYESESSVLRLIARMEKQLEELAVFDDTWMPHREALRESRYRIEDVAYAARDYAAGSDFSPERLEQVNQRLYALEKLIKKYGSSCREILEYMNQCTRELEEMLLHADSAARLSEQLALEMDAYRQRAENLSDKRRKDARRLEKEIQKEFAALAMEQMEMRVHFHPHDESEASARIPGCYGLNGIDHVEFLIAPNKGEEIRPLTRIASGGELSRLMLAIKSLCGNEEADRTLVFDEVDTGIGGRVAESVGKRLRDISGENQVLCVTHLPQIAAFARRHFSVIKEVMDGRTETITKSLNESERVQELSRMLGGETITPATRSYASEMLERSAEALKSAESMKEEPLQHKP
jgi:DNA repair protein RecN (Recombination protein N)